MCVIVCVYVCYSLCACFALCVCVCVVLAIVCLFLCALAFVCVCRVNTRVVVFIVTVIERSCFQFDAFPLPFLGRDGAGGAARGGKRRRAGAARTGRPGRAGDRRRIDGELLVYGQRLDDYQTLTLETLMFDRCVSRSKYECRLHLFQFR